MADAAATPRQEPKRPALQAPLQPLPAADDKSRLGLTTALEMKRGVPMVAVEPLPRRPARGPRVTLAWLLREAAWQLLPEPAPKRIYRPPAEYAVENGRVYYSDGMDEGYEPNLFTKAFAVLTLGLYIGVPQIILVLAVLAFWHSWARLALLAVAASAFAPLRPLAWRSVLSSYVFLAWRRYFKFSFVFDESLNAYKDYVIAQFPHGAFPMGSLLSGTFMATEYPEYNCYALAANNSFLVPVWRHVHTWLGTMAATERNFRRLLALGTRVGLRAAAKAERRAKREAAAAEAAAAGGGAAGGGASSSDSEDSGDDAPAEPALAGGVALPVGAAAEGAAARRTRVVRRNPQGVSVGVMVGGIAEMYLLHPDYEQIKLLDRKGFVRIAIEHGAELLPVYMFGVSRMMSFGPPWLMNVGRRLRMSIGVMYGLWGTPVPRRVPMRMAVGVPISVGPAMPRSAPGFEEHVERMHAAMVEGVKAVYYKHRAAYGWADRPLVIV